MLGMIQKKLYHFYRGCRKLTARIHDFANNSFDFRFKVSVQIINVICKHVTSNMRYEENQP